MPDKASDLADRSSRPCQNTTHTVDMAAGVPEAAGAPVCSSGRAPRMAVVMACGYFLSRSSRRKILPTGVLGSSVNSITLGCL